MILINSYYIINVVFVSLSAQIAHGSFFMIDLCQYYEDSQGSVINMP